MPNDKHVIFLGAGASLSSGYPIGNEMRLLLSDRRRLREELELEKAPEERIGTTVVEKFLDPYTHAIDLLRKGGFGTIDEFSRLMSRRHPENTVALKKLMRLALLVTNPEDSFEKSDYYPFVQRLFDEDNLDTLKAGGRQLRFSSDDN